MVPVPGSGRIALAFRLYPRLSARPFNRKGLLGGKIAGNAPVQALTGMPASGRHYQRARFR